jgi:hypothetical protein
MVLSSAGICKSPRLTIAKHHWSSASLDGPYWNNINFNPLLSIANVRHLSSIVVDYLALPLTKLYMAVELNIVPWRQAGLLPG